MEFIGTEQNDILQGTAENDTLDGGGGDDQIFGSAGDDLIRGGAGNDSLTGADADAEAFFTSGGRDSLEGGEGDDIYLISQAASGGTVVLDEQGVSGITVAAENADLNTIISAADLPPEEVANIFSEPSLWGDAAIKLSAPQSGIVGLERSGTDLIIDLNRDGVAETENDFTIANYFNEEGNLGAGAPLFFNNIFDQQSVVDLVNSTPQSGAENPNNGEDSSGTTVYRFYNNNAEAHFYTASETERDAVQGLDNFSFEGESYNTPDPLTGDTVPVYRFLNEDTGVHLYTIDERERDAVQGLDNFSFEGEAFSAYATEVEGSIPIYRFFNTDTGAHFYTPSTNERDVVEDTLPDFQSEGIAYYALPSEGDQALI
jgi:hypothetical protein